MILGGHCVKCIFIQCHGSQVWKCFKVPTLNVVKFCEIAMTPLTKSLVECLSRARHYWEKLLGQIGTEFVPNLSKSVINFPWIVFRLYIHVPRSVRGARRLQTRPIVGVTFIHNPHTLSVGICVPRWPRICPKIVRMKIANLFFSSIMAVLHFIQPFLFSFAPCNIIAEHRNLARPSCVVLVWCEH